MSYSAEHPWIRERESILCTWNPQQDGGMFTNAQVSPKIDPMTFSDAQIRAYVRMLKRFGYTGLQITDGCFCWRPYGSVHYVHAQIRRFAEALHAEGMGFTLWVWAACFTGFGWNDPTVTYTAANGGRAYDDPAVYAVFDRYYDLYSELADVTDRLILHFADPGYLSSHEDIFAFARLLEGKFRAKNPAVRFGIETWGSDDDFPDTLAAAGFADHLLLELPFLPTWSEEGKRARFRTAVKEAGCRLGSWGWYTVDMEIDQLPNLFVNSRVLADVYRKTREQGDTAAVPEYWAELSAYPVLNFASCYSAAQLLIDPERDPDDLEREAAALFFGEKYGPAVTRALGVIRDARSGDTWSSYWWADPGHILGGEDPASIRQRAEASLAELTEAARDRASYGALAAPIEPWEMLELMLPHLEQIRRFAEFRLVMDKAEALLAAGADKTVLAEAVDAAWQPIPDFNTIVGIWGQAEAREQDRTVSDFCRRAGLEKPRRPAWDWKLKRRFMDGMIYKQRGQDTRREFAADFFAGPYAFADDAPRIMDALAAEGLLEKNGNGTYSLADWDEYRWNFN